jgi:hypothetical protein
VFAYLATKAGAFAVSRRTQHRKDDDDRFWRHIAQIRMGEVRRLLQILFGFLYDVLSSKFAGVAGRRRSD